MGYLEMRILALICVGVFSARAAAQCDPIDRDSSAAVRQEVNRIFNKTLDAMESTLPSGVKATTWMPPDDSVHSHIKCLGAVAVPATAEILASTDRSFGHLLAIKMLGWEGGPEIIPPLARVLSKSGDPLMLKLEALEALASAPPGKALPIVQEVLHSEKNPDLLTKAASVAARLQGLAKD